MVRREFQSTIQEEETQLKDSMEERTHLLDTMERAVEEHGNKEDLRNQYRTFDEGLTMRRFLWVSPKERDIEADIKDFLKKNSYRVDEEEIAFQQDQNGSNIVYTTPSEYGKMINQGARIAATVNNLLSVEDEGGTLINEQASFIEMTQDGKLVSPGTSGAVHVKINNILTHLTKYYPDILCNSLQELQGVISFEMPKIEDSKISPQQFNALDQHTRRLVFSKMLSAFYRPGKYPVVSEKTQCIIDDRDKKELEELYKNGVVY